MTATEPDKQPNMADVRSMTASEVSSHAAVLIDRPPARGNALAIASVENVRHMAEKGRQPFEALF